MESPREVLSRHGIFKTCQPAKRSAGVASEVNLRNPLHSDNDPSKWAIHPGIETQGRRNQKSKTWLTKKIPKNLKKDVPGLFPSLVTLCLVAPELIMHTNWVSVRDTASMSHSESSNLIYKKGKEIVKQNRMFFCRVKWGVRGMDSKLFKYFLLTFITYWLKTISNYLTFCSMNWSTMCNSKRIKMNWVNWATFI